MAYSDHSCNFVGILLTTLDFHLQNQTKHKLRSLPGKIKLQCVVVCFWAFRLPHKVKANRFFSKLEIHKIENAKLYGSDDEIKRDSTKKMLYNYKWIQKSITSNEKKHLSLSQFHNAKSTNGSSVKTTVEKAKVGLWCTQSCLEAHSTLKKLLESSKIYMKLKDVSEPTFRYVHCNHSGAGAGTDAGKGLKWPWKFYLKFCSKLQVFFSF